MYIKPLSQASFPKSIYIQSLPSRNFKSKTFNQKLFNQKLPSRNFHIKKLLKEKKNLDISLNRDAGSRGTTLFHTNVCTLTDTDSSIISSCCNGQAPFTSTGKMPFNGLLQGEFNITQALPHTSRQLSVAILISTSPLHRISIG